MTWDIAERGVQVDDTHFDKLFWNLSPFSCTPTLTL